jgi:hypothetical protein
MKHLPGIGGRVIVCSVAAIGWLFATSGNSSAQTATFTPSKDNTLYEESAGQLSNGQGDLVFIGKTDSRDGFRRRRALIAFNLSSIPSNATVTGATLTLTLARSSSGNTTTTVRKVLKDWGEGASNAGSPGGAGTQAQSGDATWLHTFYNTGFWTTPGGDFAGAASASITVGSNFTTYSWSGSGMVADVQSWISDPATNFGWVVLGDEVTNGSAKAFHSGEAASGGPQLTVTYTTPTATPTPSPSPSPSPSATPPQLLNISTRMRVETGDNALIGGFIVTGDQPKRVILRAIGPSLTQQSVAGALADPTLELFSGNGTPIMFNDNWKDTQRAEIEATTIPPSNDAEAAIVRTLDPGNYTAVVRGKNNTTGVGLIEAYDLAQSANSRLANISTRGLVQTGTNVMIGGFIVGGEGNARVILRGMGPSLSQQGVPNPLLDPTLQLVDNNGTPVEANDNWRDDPDQAEIAAAGVAPGDDRESALLANIPAGNYTAVVAGKNNTTGVGLVEVYHLR